MRNSRFTEEQIVGFPAWCVAANLLFTGCASPPAPTPVSASVAPQLQPEPAPVPGTSARSTAGQVSTMASAEVEVQLGPDGQITSYRLLRSSGSAEWDAAVLKEVGRTKRLPADVNGNVPRTEIIKLTPQ